MSKALPLAVREEIFRLYECGTSLVEISEQLKVPYGTVRLHCKRFRLSGQKGLVTQYSNCGLKGSHIDQAIVEACIHLRSQREWGARRILVELSQMFKDKKLPSERSINYLLHREKNN